MDFLYPKFNKETHKIKETKSISRDLPKNASFVSRVDLEIQAGTPISVIQENVGPSCEWSKVIVVGQENTNETFYTTKNNLISTGGKVTYQPICSLENEAIQTLPELNPNTKEVFIPYIDKKNGLYSVRIQTDYTKVLDSFIFENLLIDIFYEGVSLLLASRGYRSDNAYIKELEEKFYTFAYINNDLDYTVNRYCEPITLTVSIPLNFFNEQQISLNDVEIGGEIVNTISFTNSSFTEQINQLLNVFSARAGDIINLTYPNKFIENFTVDFEIASLRAFSVAFNEFFAIEGFPINSQKFLEYEFGFDQNFNLIRIKIIDDSEEKILSAGSLSRFRLIGNLYNQRIFNYFLKIKSILVDVRRLEIQEFITKYVDYPATQLLTNTININGKPISPAKQEAFRLEFDRKAEECLTLKDLASLTRDATDTLTFLDPVYHIFIKRESIKNIEDYNFVKNLQQQGKSFEDAITNLTEERKKEQASIVSQQDKMDKAGKDKSILTKIASSFKEGLTNIPIEAKDGVADGFRNIIERRGNLNTLVYCLNRININEVLIRNLICLLKGSDYEDAEVREIINNISPDLFNYINYLSTVKNLQGADYVKAVASGNVPDIKLYCAKNSSLIYLVKWLSLIVKTFNVTGRALLQVKAAATLGAPIPNPTRAFVSATVLAIEGVVVELLLNLTNELLSTTGNCDEPPLNNQNDYRDPYNTHQTFPRFNNTNENNNQEIIKQNRSDVVQSIYNNELQFGFDKEYVVDIIGDLLRDVNCILTPIESVNLLRGEDNEIVKVLIKNIIRTKYSKPPNDLSFLLNDDNKLKAFFIELGLTVDQEVLTSLTSVLTNYLEPSEICDEPTLRARAELFQNKLPKNLDTLNRRLDRRKREAKKIFDRLANGETIIDIAPLCPDRADAELEAAKGEVLQSYYDAIRSTFLPTINDFTTEAKNIIQGLGDKRNVYEQNKPEFKRDFYIFAKDIYKNLEDVGVKFNLENNSLDVVSKSFQFGQDNNDYFYLDKFFNRDDESSLAELEKTYIPTGQEDELVKYCLPEDETFTPRPDFLDFINAGNVFVEFADFYDLNDVKETGGKSIADYKGDKKDTPLGRVLNSLEYFQVIILNRDSLSESDSDEVLIHFYRNDRLNNEFRSIDKIYAEGIEFESRKLSDRGGLTDVIVNGFVPLLNNFEVLDDEEDLYRIRNFAEFDQLEPTIKQFLQYIFVQKYVTVIANINNFIKIKNAVEIFRDKGLFSLKTLISKNSDKLTKKITLTRGRPSANLPADGDNIFNGIELFDDDYFAYDLKIKEPRNFDFDLFLKRQATISQSKAFLLGDNNFLQRQTATQKEVKITIGGDYTVGEVKVNIPQKELTYTQGGSLFDDNAILKDFKFIPNVYFKIGPSSFEQKTLEEQSKSEQIPASVDPSTFAYTKLTAYDYYLSKKFKKCNVYPHYLNLDFLIKRALEIKKEELCILDNYEPYSILKIILLELTIRVYVTDLLLKAIPFITRFTKEEQLNFYKEEVYVKILEEFIKKELQQFCIETSPNDREIYFKILTEIANEVYEKYEEKDFIKEQFIPKNLNNKIEYFIKKEIYRFFKYGIEKNAFTSLDTGYNDFTNFYFQQLAFEAIQTRAVQIGRLTEVEIPFREKEIQTIETERQNTVKRINEINAELSFFEDFFGDRISIQNYDGPNSKKRIVDDVYLKNQTEIATQGQKDTDLDGLSDAAEKIIGTQPSNPDTDNDTVGDAFEKYKNEEITNQQAVASGVVPDSDKYKGISINDRNRAVLEEQRKVKLDKIKNEIDNKFAEKRQLEGSDGKSGKLKELRDELTKSVGELIKLQNELSILRKKLELIDIPSSEINFYKEVFKLDFQSYLTYFLTANTIDNSKRVLFYSTKSTLAQIFFSNIGNLTKNQEIIDNTEQLSQGKSVEDIISFINNISYSPSPALLLAAEPQYSKYIKFALDSLLTATHSILSTVANASDINVRAGKLVNLIGTTTLSIAYSLLDEKMRNQLIVKDSSLTFKRISDGRGFVPDAGPITVATLVNLPAATLVGISYVAVDVLSETRYYLKARDEVNELRALANKDPCEVTPETAAAAIGEEISECDADRQKALINEINAFEEVET
jgi:hypothetical protein